MSKLTNEQIAAIVAYSGFAQCSEARIDQSIPCELCNGKAALYREILTLRQRVVELEKLLFDVREVLDSCDQSCLGDASNSEGMVWAVRDEVIHDITVALNKSQQPHKEIT